MKEIEFQIFQKRKGLHLSANKVVYTLLGISISTFFLADKFFGGGVIETIGQSFGILAFIMIVYYVITQLINTKTLKGNLNGVLKFRENEIEIKAVTYNIDDLAKIEFYKDDFYGKLDNSGYGNFNPARSNGVGNFIKIIFPNGHTVKTNFQINYEGEFLKMRELLIHYYTKGKISLLGLLEYLEIDKYEEIQKFKKTLPPTIYKNNA